MAKAERSVVIEAPIEKVFEVIGDYANYPKFLPEVKGAEVVKKADHTEVTYDVDLKVKRIKYTLKHMHAPPNKATWTLVKGEMMSGNDGSWNLESLGPSRTKATYTIEIKLGPLVPGFIVKGLTEQSLPEMLENFRKRSEAHAKGTV
jgi:ribosome-associated toxin RatA of RatAB toxin-antitoxin module